MKSLKAITITPPPNTVFLAQMRIEKQVKYPLTPKCLCVTQNKDNSKYVEGCASARA